MPDSHLQSASDTRETDDLIKEELLHSKQEIADLKNNLRELETKMSALLSAKDKFFNIIAVDLKHSLTSLIGTTALLHNELNNFTLNEIAEFTDHINRSANAVYSTAENLLEWAALQTGLTKAIQTEVDLSSAATEVCNTFEHSASTRQTRLMNEIPQGIYVSADKAMVKAILRNLISNALKFSNPPAQIKVGTEITNDMAKISVADSGTGMDEKTCSGLFRIDANEKTGLGLLLCKEMVEKNNGTIWCESSPGNGTTMYFTLPLFAAQS